MSDFFNFSPEDGASLEESIQSTLQSGLTALKQKKYQAAIVQLETVYQTATHVPTLLKAQMGLVKAYGSTGKGDRAISLCESLQNHANPQVQAWAQQTLTELKKRSSQDFVAPESDRSGFTPLSQPSSQPLSQSRSQPLSRPTPSPAAETNPPDATGFVPLSASPATARERITSKPRQPEVDRPLEEPEETEILPLDAADAAIDWQTAIDSPKPEKSPVPSKSILPSRPAVASPSPTPRTAVQPTYSPLVWRQAGRAQKWTSLGKTDTSFLWALLPLTVLLLGWVICVLIQIGEGLLNGLIFFLSWMPFLQSVWISGNPVWGVAIVLIVLLAASPWLLHRMLSQLYQMQPLSLSELEHHSPESVRLLKRVSNQRGRPVPTLSVLPQVAPLAFSYGWLPNLAHIAVSQGLLQQLSDDEIATIYAAELGHIDHWDWGVLSGLVCVAQLPYRVYWSVADWGNQQTDRVLQSVAVLVSSIGYGVYWCCRLAGLGLSRVRLYYSDRSAVNLTGNPNGLSRALLKITLGIAAEIQQQGYTDPLLESFDLLLPVTHRSALTLGSFYPHMPIPALFAWDRSHRFRRWFACTTSHGLMGDRLYKLSVYAQRWRLDAELDWSQEQRTTQNPKSKPPSPTIRRFLLQMAPLVGVLLGLAIGLALWLLGWITYKAHSYSFDWLWYERQAIAIGCMLLGFGIGLLIQINPAFRDLPRSSLQTEADLAALLSEPTALPIDSTPVRFQGKLLGRRHFHNRCYQDLLLQTATGLVRLHYSSRGGFLGNLISQSQRPTDLMKPNEIVSVTGWFRRGATPWIDVETIQSKRGITVRSGYPVWLAVVAIISALGGVYIIF